MTSTEFLQKYFSVPIAITQDILNDDRIKAVYLLWAYFGDSYAPSVIFDGNITERELDHIPNVRYLERLTSTCMEIGHSDILPAYISSKYPTYLKIGINEATLCVSDDQRPLYNITDIRENDADHFDVAKAHFDILPQTRIKHAGSQIYVTEIYDELSKSEIYAKISRKDFKDDFRLTELPINTKSSPENMQILDEQGNSFNGSAMFRFNSENPII